MGAKKKVKKKIEPKIARNRDICEDCVRGQHLLEQKDISITEAIECLKHYTKKDQIGELANQAIELLTKWGISF